MSWFSRRKDAPSKPEPVARERATLATNAPADWPRVEVGALPEGPAAQPVLEAAVAAGLKRGFEAQGSMWSLARMACTQLVADGVIEWPIAVSDPINRMTPVAVYARATADEASHFAGLTRVLKDAGLRPPVYYAPSPLGDAPPVNPTQPFGPWSLRRWTDPVPPTTYALWWRAPGDDSFAASRAGASFDRFVTALDGYTTYFLGSLAANLGIREDNARLALPPELLVPVETPGQCLVLLSASQEKGIRLHFPTDTPREDRELLLHHLAQAAESMRAGVVASGAPLDDAKDREWARNWAFLRKTAAQQDPEQIGVIKLGAQ